VENASVSLWGGREHFITALVGASSKVCMYFEEWDSASVEVGEEGSGVGERDVNGDGGGESSRARLGIGLSDVAVRE
jgi:hypothetical protein